MKKKIYTTCLLAVAFLLTACGGKKQSITYRLEEKKESLSITDTMTLTAKGDAVQKIAETIVFDLSFYDEDTRKLMIEAYAALAESYQAVDGVECTGKEADDIYTIEMQIDAEEKTLTKLTEQGLLQVDGDTDRISLTKTGTALEEAGYTKVD